MQIGEEYKQASRILGERWRTALVACFADDIGAPSESLHAGILRGYELAPHGTQPRPNIDADRVLRRRYVSGRHGHRRHRAGEEWQ